jgi:hypothetical protein
MRGLSSKLGIRSTRDWRNRVKQRLVEGEDTCALMDNCAIPGCPNGGTAMLEGFLIWVCFDHDQVAQERGPALDERLRRHDHE